MGLILPPGQKVNLPVVTVFLDHWIPIHPMSTKRPRDPNDVTEECEEDPLDVFYLFFGLLRNSIREVSPSTWKNLFKNSR